MHNNNILKVTSLQVQMSYTIKQGVPTAQYKIQC